MALFQSLEPTVLKESSSTVSQIEKLKDILPKASAPVQEAISQDISLLEMGLYGENKILFELKNSHIPMYILHDIYLSKNGLSAQIDFLVICPKCTYIIECKNLFGNIEINNKGEFIRTVQLGKGFRKEGIYSPITQNQRHLEIMRDFVLESNVKAVANKLFGDAFAKTNIPIVVLANDKTVLNDRYAKKDIKEQVIRGDQLVAFIKEHESKSRNPKRFDSEMKDVAEIWLARHTENQTDYIEKYRTMEREYRAKVKSETKDEKPPICPDCGIQMVIRTAKTGDSKGKQFWGCPNYPKCRRTLTKTD